VHAFWFAGLTAKTLLWLLCLADMIDYAGSGLAVRVKAASLLALCQLRCMLGMLPEKASAGDWLQQT